MSCESVRKLISCDTRKQRCLDYNRIVNINSVVLKGRGEFHSINHVVFHCWTEKFCQ